MPIRGTKPAEQKRHRIKSPVDWTEVPQVPHEGAPELPESPRPDEGIEPPEPGRPLGMHGRDLWNRTWRRIGGSIPDVDALQALCELTDERIPLRVQVLRDGDRFKRNALRDLDRLIMAGLVELDRNRRPFPARWPVATRRWWAAVSKMPHCCLWDDTDWEFAVDTARIAALFHAGDPRFASELRTREKILGTTFDSRRDLRIRYTDPAADDEERRATVTAMDQYKKMAAKLA